MNKNLQTVYHYHETTKHAPQRYARSLGYMDWATQPNPFRNYLGAKKFELVLSFENATLPYHLLNAHEITAPLCWASLAQFLQFSMGIAAWKESGGSSWAVRCNASSGNLHPTETYLILPSQIFGGDDATKESKLFHYGVQNHELEDLATFPTALEANTFVVALSSISWREVWKYGERAFRYVNLDSGHAWQSLVTSAKMLGWSVRREDSLDDVTMAKLLGLDQKERFSETEIPDMFLIISTDADNDAKVDFETLLSHLPQTFHGVANRLSPTMQEWNIIPAIEEATSQKEIPQKEVATHFSLPQATQESKDVVLGRRSVHVMDKEESHITKDAFHTILKSVSHSLDAKEPSAHLTLFVHRVAEYEKGLYILVRNERDLQNLHKSMHKNFLWKACQMENLYLLEVRDLTMQSKAISCAQDIASDGAFSLGMLCNFDAQLQSFGAHRYKELYWECGAIGQQLYLEATSLGLSGTGIGCFLDDMMHGLLGLQDNKFQILYHFTVGVGYVDSRIQTRAAYKQRL